MATPTLQFDAATKKYADDGLALKANQATTYTKTETDSALALKANLSYVDSTFLPLAGGLMTGNLDSNNNRVIVQRNASNNHDAVNLETMNGALALKANSADVPTNATFTTL